MSTNSSAQSAKQSKRDAAPTSKRAAAIAHDAIDSASGKAEQVEEKVRAEAAKLAEKSSEGAAEAKKQFDATVNRVEGFVKERPLAAAGIAFAAGALGALLLKRSS